MATGGIYVVRNYAIRVYSAKVKAGVPELVQRTLAKIDTAAKRDAPYKTGTLRRSITHQMNGPASGWVGSRNVPYARIQDLGGKTSPHIIVPRFRQALYWPGAAHPVKVVHHPGSVIPGNRYLSKNVQAQMAVFNRELARLLRP